MVKQSKRFLAVGIRSNVDLTAYASHFDNAFRISKPFQDNAQDYFTVPPNVWDWDAVPPFQVGRPAYE